MLSFRSKGIIAIAAIVPSSEHGRDCPDRVSGERVGIQAPAEPGLVELLPSAKKCSLRSLRRGRVDPSVELFHCLWPQQLKHLLDQHRSAISLPADHSWFWFWWHGAKLCWMPCQPDHREFSPCVHLPLALDSPPSSHLSKYHWPRYLNSQAALPS